jgi:hypothetical protein
LGRGVFDAVEVVLAAVFDFVLATVPEDSLVDVPLVLVVGVEDAVPVDGAPVTVTTCGGGLLRVPLLPERPISTPIPIASRRIPIMEMRVLLTGAKRRCTGALPGVGSGGRRAGPSSRLTRGAPRRSPHSTQ